MGKLVQAEGVCHFFFGENDRGGSKKAAKGNEDDTEDARKTMQRALRKALGENEGGRVYEVGEFGGD